MKFKQYIHEASIDNIIMLIEDDCQPFIKDWQKLNTIKWLMSGRQNQVKEIEKRAVRKDRTPVDTPKMIHQLMDDWFKKKFGVNSRSNAVFCSFNPNLVSDYGELFLIFPIGKYKAISSPVIDDVYSKLSRNIAEKYTDHHGIYSARTWAMVISQNEEEIVKDVLDLLNKGKYMDKLKHVMGEIMVTCKDYYMVNKKYNGDLLDHFRW